MHAVIIDQSIYVHMCRLVVLDPVLWNALSCKEEALAEELNWAQVMDRYIHVQCKINMCMYVHVILYMMYWKM